MLGFLTRALSALIFIILFSMPKISIGSREPFYGLAPFIDAVPISAHEEDEAVPLMKADRLQLRSTDDPVRSRAALDALKAALAKAVPKDAEDKKDDIVSWHWHEGSKIVRRRSP